MESCWASAAKEFDVFVTVDRNLAAQQNPSAVSIAIVVLGARSNRLADLRPLVPKLLRAIEFAKPGVVELIDAA